MTYTQISGGCFTGNSSSKVGTCEICGAKKCADIYEAALFAQGDWVWACEECFKKHSGKLGFGLGQHYRKDGNSLPGE